MSHKTVPFHVVHKESLRRWLWHLGDSRFDSLNFFIIMIHNLWIINYELVFMSHTVWVIPSDASPSPIIDAVAASTQKLWSTSSSSGKFGGPKFRSSDQLKIQSNTVISSFCKLTCSRPVWPRRWAHRRRCTCRRRLPPRRRSFWWMCMSCLCMCCLPCLVKDKKQWSDH